MYSAGRTSEVSTSQRGRVRISGRVPPWGPEGELGIKGSHTKEDAGATFRRRGKSYLKSLSSSLSAFYFVPEVILYKRGIRSCVTEGGFHLKKAECFYFRMSLG